VVEPLGHAQAVLGPDDIGFRKTGQQSGGVARRYSGTSRSVAVMTGDARSTHDRPLWY